METLRSGTVVWIVHDRGYGFIKPDDDDEDVFFNYRSLRDFALAYDGADRIDVDRTVALRQRVTFIARDTDRGFRAVEVRPQRES